MSVFTPVSDADARALLEHYTLGELEGLEGIAQGVENTNYFLTTTTGAYVLTLFEHIPRADLPFYVGLMDHLAHHDMLLPGADGARRRRDAHRGERQARGHRDAAARRAAHRRPTPARLPPVGRILADIHVAGVEYDAALANWRGAGVARGASRRSSRPSSRRRRTR